MKPKNPHSRSLPSLQQLKPSLPRFLAYLAFIAVLLVLRHFGVLSSDVSTGVLLAITVPLAALIAFAEAVLFPPQVPRDFGQTRSAMFRKD